MNEGGTTSERVVWPIALAFLGKTQVMAAWCELRSGFRHFRADRISHLTPLGLRYPTRRVVLYLAAQAPNQTLYPAELSAQAPVNRWMFWCSAHFQPAISVLNWEYFVKKVAALGELVTPLMTAKQARLPIAPFKHLQSWLARMQDRESWQRTNPPS